MNIITILTDIIYLCTQTPVAFAVVILLPFLVVIGAIKILAILDNIGEREMLKINNVTKERTCPYCGKIIKSSAAQFGGHVKNCKAKHRGVTK